MEHIERLGFKESNGADIVGLRRPLATEINIPPLRPIENMRIHHQQLKIADTYSIWAFCAVNATVVYTQNTGIWLVCFCM